MAGEVTLTSQDGQEIKVAVDVIKQSKIVWQMLQDLGSEDANDEIEALPIPNVNYAILKKIITWCEKHKDDAPEEENFNEKKSTDNSLPKWDSEFLKVDQGTLFGTESFSVSIFYSISINYYILFDHGFSCKII